MVKFYHILYKERNNLNKYSNELIIFMGLSIAVGGISRDFINDSGLIVGVSISAVSFSFFDLLSNFDKRGEWPLKLQNSLLFLGVFSIIVVPYIPFLVEKISGYTNYFTIYSLSLVIILMGYKQKKFEKNSFESLKNTFDRQSDIVKEQKEIIREKQKVIEALQIKLKNKNE